MNIETYIITWNREDCIHLTINYYKAFSKVIIYDNHSDDNTPKICKALGAEVRTFGTKGVLNDQDYLDVKNNCWKGSKADWVIIVDDDEIFATHEIFKKTTSTILKPQGYSMFSESMPENSWFEITTGYEDEKYSKLCCFRPDMVQEINYIYGCHESRPKFNGVISEQGYLFHYNAVGGAQRMIDRHALYEPRRQRSPINMKWGLGKEYGYSPESKRIWFQEQLRKSRELSFLGTL